MPITGSCVFGSSISSSVTAGCIGLSIVLALFALLVSFSIVVLIYIAGEIIGISSLKGAFRAELWETIKTAFLIGCIFFVLILLSGLAASLVGAPSPVFASSTSNPVTVALDSNLNGLYASDNAFINSQIQNINVSFYATLGVSEGFGIMRSINISLWSPSCFPSPTLLAEAAVEALGSPEAAAGEVPSALCYYALQSGFVSTPIYSSDYLEGANTGMINSIETFAIVPTLLLLYIESNLIYFIVSMALLVLLPLGILFKALPFLRPIGALLIAVAIGIALIYPVLLIALNQPIINYVANTFAIPLYSASPSAAVPTASVLNPGSTCSSSTSKSTVETAVCSFAKITGFITTIPFIPTSIHQYTNVLSLGIGEAYLSINTVYPAINFTLRYAILPIVEITLFIIDLMITFILINNVSAVLGGPNLERGFGRKIKFI